MKNVKISLIELKLDKIRELKQEIHEIKSELNIKHKLGTSDYEVGKIINHMYIINIEEAECGGIYHIEYIDLAEKF